MTTATPPAPSFTGLEKPSRSPLCGVALPDLATRAPIRLRVERQLGDKHAKYGMKIELVDSFAGIAGGKGGYWEDQGYQWFAGI